MMVLVLAYEHDTHSWRASQTKDADIVVDVVADRTVLSATTQTLQAQGFTLDASVGSGTDVSRCTFSSYKSQIDVLCPSDATPDMLDTADGLRSIAIPGGRRALGSARAVNLYISEDYYDVKLCVPNVTGAIMVKAAAAIDERTSDGQRHIDDVAFLLGLPFDLRTVADDLEPGDSDLLNQLRPRLTNPTDPVWDQYPARYSRCRCGAAPSGENESPIPHPKIRGKSAENLRPIWRGRRRQRPLPSMIAEWTERVKGPGPRVK